MSFTKAKLITIITERILRNEIITMLKSKGATGYTQTDATGEGSRGIRASDWEGRNVKIETIVSEPVAAAIMGNIAENYFENYAVIVYLRDVEVMRGEKYISK
jgi:hypothetical protein